MKKMMTYMRLAVTALMATVSVDAVMAAGVVSISGQTKQFITNSATPGNAYGDFIVPNMGGFVDNVLTIGNKSTNGTIYGNAALRFVDGAGTERGAVGYSRNTAIQPNGFYPNLLYNEIGNPFTTDVQDTDWAVVVTHSAGAAYFPNTSLKAIEVSSSLGSVDFRSQGTGQITSHGNSKIVGGDFGIGDLTEGVPRQLSVAMSTTAARLREYGTTNNFAYTTNVSNLNAGAITKDVPADPAWKMQMGAGYDQWKLSHADSAATTWTDLLSVSNTGVITAAGPLKMQVAPSVGSTLTVDDSLPVSVANGATYTLAAGSGIVMLNDYTGGQAAVYLVSATNIVMISQTGTQYVVGAPGAGQVGLQWSGSAYQIANNKGAGTTFGVMTFASRQTN